MTEMTEAAQHVAVEAAKPDVLGTLGINWQLFLAQLVNVGIILVALGLWVFKPLAKLMEERRKKIEDGVAHAAEADRRLSSAKTEQEAVVSAAKAEARVLVDEARKAGERERAERVEASKRDIDAQIEDAKTKIRLERDAALEAARREVAGLVTLATRKVTSQEIDEATQRDAIKAALAELEHAKIDV